MKIAETLKLQNAEKEFNAFYFFQQFTSPHCRKTVEQAIEEYGNLKTKKDKLRFVKEQIHIRYLGLGWEQAHHAWSRNGRMYEPDELFEHLVSVVIPMQITEKIPSKPPVNLPKQPDNTTLGTKSSAVVELDSKLANKETELRVNAML